MANISDFVRYLETQERPEFLPRQLDVMGLIRRLAITNPMTAARELPGKLAESRQMLENYEPGQQVSPELMNQFMNLVGGFAPMGMVSPAMAAKALPETKILDESGNPKMLFHGTNKAYENYSESALGTKTGNPTSLLGFFFSGSPKEASRYTTDWGKEGGNVRPVYLDIKNPKRLTYKQVNDISMATFDESLPVNAWKTKEGQEAIKAAGERAKKMAVDLKESLIKEGYDGAVVKIGGQDEYIAFYPQQIKSAISDPAFASLLD